MTVAVLLHLSSTVAFVAAIYYFEFVMEPPLGDIRSVLDGYGGRCKFLTHLNMLLQCGYFVVALLNDVLGSSEREPSKQTTLQRIRDWLFTSLAFPLGCFVTFIFWSLYAVDRELIFPSNMDSWFPSWLNHVMHTLPLSAAVVEQITVYHKHQRGYSRLFPIAAAYILYLTWLVYIKMQAGFWVYPVFDVLTPMGRTLFLLVLSVPALLFFVIGETLHVKVWGLEPPTRQARSKTSSKKLK